MTILMQRHAHTPARLSLYFTSGILRPRQKSERGRFLPLVVAWLSFERAPFNLASGRMPHEY